MFWKGKVTAINQLTAFVKQNDVALASDLPKPELSPTLNPHCKISSASLDDTDGIAKLLNDWFEENTKVKSSVTADWIRYTFLRYAALWIIAKDRGGTIRGCISSFRILAPYPNSLGGCSLSQPWGIVDWFCVHPLWRSKGLGTDLLEALDLITFKIGRMAHIFLKEGLPLPLPHIPVYSTFLRCRKAGNTSVKEMREGTGLTVYPYMTKEKATELPLVRVEGLRSTATISDIQEWEDAIDKDLPPCIVFVSGPDKIDPSRGWKTDSLVSMYAFRWIPGKWLGSPPNIMII
jgi:GNAT superfamily N-acetyltransferase